MLTQESLQEFTKKLKTPERNVIREYTQHLCLANLYKNKEAQNLLFKGSTSLKFIYQSPRFSEDLAKINDQEVLAGYVEYQLRKVE